MRAIAVRQFGAAPELMELPEPTPAAGELRIRLTAAGLNPFDWKVADGVLDGRLPHVFPLVLGMDGAGTVDALGDGVTQWRVGDQVYGQFFAPPVGRGTFADYVCVPATVAMARTPGTVSLAAAAGAPTAGMTAITLRDALWSQSAESADGSGPASAAGSVDGPRTVLVVGATGGVGSFFTQLAAANGAHVVATASSGQAERMRSLGAAETVDFAKGSVIDQVRSLGVGPVDALVDLVSPAPAFAELARLVAAGGAALTTIGAADVEALAARKVRGVNIQMRASSELLGRLTAEIDAGRLRIPVEHELRLDEAAKAISENKSGRARGKTVFVI